MLRPDATVTPREMEGAGTGGGPSTMPMLALRSAAQGALIESRQRWRDLVGLAADLAFETDAEGRIGFLAPDQVLGWPAAALLGRHPLEEGLLVRPEPDPFSLRAPARDVRAWLRRMRRGGRLPQLHRDPAARGKHPVNPAPCLATEQFPALAERARPSARRR